MAAGAAVIAADIGGIPEAVEDAGILVPPDDADALAGALGALADDEGLLEERRRAALAHARRRDWSTSRARLDEVLAPVLSTL
jgi:glycosyltransferase involved in cell wall biosynthesis